jgi:hypothetical protein
VENPAFRAENRIFRLENWKRARFRTRFML